MSLYRQLLFPLVRQFDPETAHERAMHSLSVAQSNLAGRWLLGLLGGTIPFGEVQVAGLTFSNPLGLAAGFDKNVEGVTGFGLLGFGHVEVGTLTPRPQPGNDRPRIFRLAEDRALINRMGFPNCGAKAALPRLMRFHAAPNRPVIGVSLGKQKETALADAAADYLHVMEVVYPYADYLAVNISSPNTPGLRELQGGTYLRALCETLQEANGRLSEREGVRRRPLFVKIAPDLQEQELLEMLDVFLATGIDGLIATNTTLARPEELTSLNLKETGGLSGEPLRTRSTDIIRLAARHTSGRLPIIGVGGITTAQDAADKLRAGASLVQLYTALVYEGPTLPGRLARELRREV